jgi:hypothetical protein
MDRETQQRFRELWLAVPKRSLDSIAAELGYSFQSLAKWRMVLGLPKRYGAEDDGETPEPQVIRLRAEAQQTNWTPSERRLRWRGPPHTIYESITTHDYEP